MSEQETTASAALSVDWSSLSDRGAWVLRYVEVPLALERRSYAEVAAALGLQGKHQIGKLRRELREELERTAEPSAG